MIFTGKAKEQFEKFLLKLIEDLREDLHGLSKECYLIDFYKEIPSMQWGVIQDFADSVDVNFEVNYAGHDFMFMVDEGIQHDFDTRQEARTEAIKQLNEYLNK